MTLTNSFVASRVRMAVLFEVSNVRDKRVTRWVGPPEVWDPYPHLPTCPHLLRLPEEIQLYIVRRIPLK